MLLNTTQLKSQQGSSPTIFFLYLHSDFQKRDFRAIHHE